MTFTRLSVVVINALYLVQSFFSSIVNKNRNSARVLFAMVKRLINPSHQLAPELIFAKKCEVFASFFTG